MNIPSLFFNPKSMKIKGNIVAEDSVLDFSVQSKKKKKRYLTFKFISSE